MMLELDPRRREGEQVWVPPVLKVIALDGEGIDELLEKIQLHMDYLKRSGRYEAKLRERVEREFMEIVKSNLEKYILEKAISKNKFDALVQQVVARQIDPYTAADKILAPYAALVDSGTETEPYPPSGKGKKTH
jgi:LAO/AO transport system kinase